MRTNMMHFFTVSVLAIGISQAFVIGPGRLARPKVDDDNGLEYSVPDACDDTCKTFVDVFAAEPVSKDCTKDMDDSINACYACATPLSNATEVAKYNEIMDDYYAYCTKIGSPVPTETGAGATKSGSSGATGSSSVAGATGSSAPGSTPTSPASTSNSTTGGDSGNGGKGSGGASSLSSSLGSLAAVVSLVIMSAGLVAL